MSGMSEKVHLCLRSRARLPALSIHCQSLLAAFRDCCCYAAEVLRQGNAQQADDILRLRADAMQLQAMAAENSRLQGEITCLQKVSSTYKVATWKAMP